MSVRGRMRDDSGAVAVVAALFIVAALLLAAVIVDAGYLYDARRQLQAAADAAALAGCQELIVSGDTGKAASEAGAYAAANAVGPATALSVDEVLVDTTEQSVRVSVSKETPVFFSRLFGPDTRRVVAVAKARRWQLAGGRYLVPWGIPVIRSVDRVEALVVSDGGAVLGSSVLGKVGTLDYRGAVAAPGAAGGYDLLVRIYNTYGVCEKLVDSQGPGGKDTPAARVVVASPTHPFESIILSGDFIAGDAPVFPTLSVRTVEPQTKVKVSIGKTTRQMNDAGGGLLWTYTVGPGDVPLTDDLLRTYPVDVHLAKEDGVDAYIHVRRSTHPVAGVDVAPCLTGPGGAVSVRVLLNEFDPTTAVPGRVYTLRVGSQGNEVGNFGELNFGRLVHTGSCPPDPPGIKPGNNYYDWTAYGYQGGVHVGDIIAMSPGGSGANTSKALAERASRLGPGEELIVDVPIVEKYEDKTGGSYDVIVVAFAAFRLVGYEKDGTVRGEFLEYVANPSQYTPSPGGGVTSALYAPRLVNP